MRHVVISALLLLLVSACKPPSDGAASGGGLPPGLQASLTLDGPAVTGPVPVRLELSGADGPAEVSGVTITGNMTHAGMQPVIVPAAQVGPHTWLADGFAFNMGGDWFLLAEVELEGGGSFEVSVPVSVRGN